jgi:hypothetical protein
MVTMPPRGLFVAAASLLFAGLLGIAHAGDNSTLSTDDLACAMGMHWWTTTLPADMPGTATIGVQWVSSDGKPLTGDSVSMTNISLTAGALIKIFCHDQPGGAAVTIQTPKGDLNTTFPGISFTRATLAGLPSGASAKNNDLLLKLIQRAADGTLTIPPANTLNPTDIGLRLVIKPGAHN